MVENTAAVRVGRLVEVRIAAGYRSAADVDTVLQRITRVIRGLPYKRFVTVADWRACPILSGDAADRLVSGLVRSNPLVERSAAIASPHASSAVLQFMRLVRESNNSNRRLFHSPEALVTWMGEVLSTEEVARLRSFLSSTFPAGSP